MNKLFLFVLLVVAGTSITFGLIGTSITFDDIETKTSPKFETKMSLRGSDFAQKFEHVSQVNDQEPLTLMQALIVEDDTYAADENEKDEDKDPCSVLLSERRENGWTEEDIGMCA